MQVRDLMQTEIRTITRDQTLLEAVVELVDAHVTGLAVVDNAFRLTGVLSTADVLQAQTEGRDGSWEERLVGDVMTPTAVTIAPDASAQEAAQVMLYRDVHRLFVVEKGQLAGVISQTDLVRAMGAHRLDA